MLKKSFGQHILVSRGVIDRIVQLADIDEDDVVVEIGGGTGNLTRALLRTGLGKVYVVELDRDMVNLLSEIKDSRLEIICGDASELEFCALGEQLKVVGNLPYNMASLILENIVFHHRCIVRGVLMFQKEVALRLSGKGEDSWLSIFLRSFYEVRYEMSVPPRFFKPPPRVQSGVISLSKRNKDSDIQDLKDYKGFLTSLFTNRRKKLGSKLKADILIKAGIDPNRRVDSLKLEEFMNLYRMVKLME